MAKYTFTCVKYVVLIKTFKKYHKHRRVRKINYRKKHVAMTQTPQAPKANTDK